MNELEKSPEGAAVSQETDKETKKRLKAEAKEKKAQEKREAKMARLLTIPCCSRLLNRLP